jgi:hypothetical protein
MNPSKHKHQCVGQAFQPAGLPDFPVRWTKNVRLKYLFSVAQPSRLRVKRASSPYSHIRRRDAARTRRRGRLRYSFIRSALNTYRLESRPNPQARKPAARASREGRLRGIRNGSWSQCMREYEKGLCKNPNVGRASRLPPSAKPKADLLCRYRSRDCRAGGTPALLCSPFKWAATKRGGSP